MMDKSMEELRKELSEVYRQMDEIDSEYRKIADFEKRSLVSKKSEIMAAVMYRVNTKS